MFYSELLKRKGEIAKDQIISHIEKCWSLRILAAPEPWHFVTCDHPSVWTSINDSQPGLHLMTLPITPKLAVAAFDRRILEITTVTMTEEDYLTLNAGQMENAVSCFYSFAPFKTELIERMRTHLSAKGEPGCAIKQGNWRFKIAGLKPQHYFSFMQLMPPLM